MGVRGCESRCLFSGSRGEVCTLEPLLLNHLPSHTLKNYTLVAMATLSKVLYLTLKKNKNLLNIYIILFNIILFKFFR